MQVNKDCNVKDDSPSVLPSLSYESVTANVKSLLVDLPWLNKMCYILIQLKVNVQPELRTHYVTFLVKYLDQTQDFLVFSLVYMVLQTPPYQ